MTAIVMRIGRRTRTRARTGARMVAALVGPTRRLVPWSHLAAGAGVAAVVVTVAIVRGPIDAVAGVAAIRAVLLLLAIGAATWLDEHVDGTLAAAPAPTWSRMLVRVAAGTVVVGTLGTAAVVVVLDQAGGTQAAVGPDLVEAAGAAGVVLPVDLVLEGVVLVLFAWVVARGSARLGSDHPGMVAAAAVAVTGVLATRLPVPTPVVPVFGALTAGRETTSFAAWTAWTSGHQRLAWIGGVLLVALVALMADPARRPRFRRLAPPSRRASRRQPPTPASASISFREPTRQSDLDGHDRPSVGTTARRTP